jgi:hypothetical protein
LEPPLKSLTLCSLVVLLGTGNSAFTQNQTAPAAAPAVASAGVPDATKPRVFITDSNSWQTMGSAGGANGAFAASSSGGARPQTAEIIKTFGQRCPQVTINSRPDVSAYVVQLEHEGGKSVFAHKDKVAVFVRQSGDSIFSKSTMSVGGSVQDACAAVLAHWATYSTAYQALSTVPALISTATAAPKPAQEASLTVESSVAGADIEVDGAFMGNTPSTLSVMPGKHTIAVKKKGYAVWSRSINVSGSGVRLNADLEATP